MKDSKLPAPCLDFPAPPGAGTVVHLLCASQQRQGGEAAHRSPSRPAVPAFSSSCKGSAPHAPRPQGARLQVPPAWGCVSPHRSVVVQGPSWVHGLRTVTSPSLEASPPAAAIMNSSLTPVHMSFRHAQRSSALRIIRQTMNATPPVHHPYAFLVPRTLLLLNSSFFIVFSGQASNRAHRVLWQAHDP